MRATYMPLAVPVIVLLGALLPQVGSALQTTPKRALVVSGGGAKGAYAAGVLSVLMRDRGSDTATTASQLHCAVPEAGSLDFDVLVGTSTGALITPLAHQRRIREMTRFYTAFGTADVLAQRPILEALTSAESFYTVEQLQSLLLEEYAAGGLWDAIRRDPGRLLVVTGVDLQRGALVLFYAGNRSNHEVAEVGYRWEPIAEEAEFLEALLASSSEPVGMPPVRWNNSLIWDGGVRSAMPLSVALAQRGVEEVWVIGLNPSPDSPMGWNTRPPASGLQVLERTINVFGTGVAANDLAKMSLLVEGWRERARTIRIRSAARAVHEAADALTDSVLREALQARIGVQLELLRRETEEKDSVLGAPSGDRRSRVQVFVIRPFESLPGSSLENTLQDQRRMYLKGRNDAKAFLDWLKQECARLSSEVSQGRLDSLSARFRVFTQPAP